MPAQDDTIKRGFISESEMRDSLIWLIANLSPWLRIPWNTPLGAPAAQSAKPTGTTRMSKRFE